MDSLITIYYMMNKLFTLFKYTYIILSYKQFFCILDELVEEKKRRTKDEKLVSDEAIRKQVSLGVFLSSMCVLCFPSF